MLKKYEFKGRTNLRRIEPHRLRELIREDLMIYKESSINDIHQRIAPELSIRSIKIQLNHLFNNKIKKKGANRHTKYELSVS